MARIGLWLLLCWLGATPRARAGGIEYSGSGAVGLGRAGATTARADDPLVLLNNPAGLAELWGDHLLLSFTFADMRACVEPAGSYGWGAYRGGAPFELRDPATGEVQSLNIGDIARVGDAEEAYYVEPLDTVCVNAARTPLPQLAWAGRITHDLGVGLGFIFPSVQPGGQWAEGEDGVIRGASGQLRPSPTRYMQIRSGNLALFPSVGVGYRVSEWFRAGLMLQWGIFSVDMTTMSAISGGTSPRNDIIARARAEDYFVPAATASIHLVPSDAWDIVLAYKYQDGVDAKGKLELTTNAFAPKSDDPLSPVTHVQDDIVLNSVRQEMPDKLSFGIRYADRLVPRPTGTGREAYDPAQGMVVHDPLQDERWDLELDVEYFFTSEVSETIVVPRAGQFVEFKSRAGDVSEARDTPVPVTTIARDWNNQVSLRLGGTYNPLPGLLGISSGVHYENRGASPRYMSVDFWPLERIGLHFGLLMRIAKQIDVAVSYAHIFQETLVVAPPPHGDRGMGEFDKSVGVEAVRGEGLEVLQEQPQGSSDGQAGLVQNLSRTAQGSPPWVVNAGTYRSGFDLLAIGLNVHW